MKDLTKVKNTLSSKSVKTEAENFYPDIIGVLKMNPVSAMRLIKNTKHLPSTIRDNIFFECFEAYLLNLNKYDSEKQQFMEDNLRQLAIALAEAGPNQEAGYEGNAEKLYEYSKRIVKMLDDCGTIQKAVYLANISRAAAKREIDKRDFFKLGQCIRMLTEEDLLFLKKDIREGTINGDADYIDDFRGVGLMYEVEGGFAYSRRAFQLLRYALDYERDRGIPEKFPERNVVASISNDEIDALFEKVNEVSENQQWKEV